MALGIKICWSGSEVPDPLHCSLKDCLGRFGEKVERSEWSVGVVDAIGEVPMEESKSEGIHSSMGKYALYGSLVIYKQVMNLLPLPALDGGRWYFW